MATNNSFTLRAKYIFPIDQPPIEGGCLTVVDGKIAEVGRQPSGNVHDLGDVAILPALINAHTHLEFSNLSEPLGERGMVFPDWIREVIRWRQNATANREREGSQEQAIRAGVAECLRTGTTSVGEIATQSHAIDTDAYAGLHGIAFYELLGLAPNRHDDLVANATSYVLGSKTTKSNSMQRD